MATGLVLKLLRDMRADMKESRKETRDNFVMFGRGSVHWSVTWRRSLRRCLRRGERIDDLEARLAALEARLPG